MIQLVAPALQGANLISKALPIASYFGFNALGEGMAASDEKRQFNPYNLVDPTGFLFQDGKGILQQGVENAPALLNEFVLGVPSAKEIKGSKRPLANLPADYKQAELAAGAAAEQYRPGAGFPGQQQAPEIPGTSMGNMAGLYEQGRSAAKTQEEMNVVRDLGLAMHAQKYGTPDQRMASTIGARNPLLDRMGLQQPSRPGVFVENPTDEYLQSEVDKKGKEVQDFLKTFNASRGKK